MPIYMDLHIVPGIEAKHAAEAHREDLKIQDQFGCRCMTYWVDETRGNAFCLIDAPNKDAVVEMHKRAHGLIPYEVIEVSSKLVEAFLGRIQDPTTLNDSSELNVFNDPAFRIILVTESMDFRLLQYRFGDQKSAELNSLYHRIVREKLKENEGREVEMEGGFIASFVSVSQAVSCAKAIQSAMHIAADLINLRLGVHAGMPVEKDSLFGHTIRFARHLCHFSHEAGISISSTVRSLYKQKLDEKADKIKCLNPPEESFLEKLTEVLNAKWFNPDFNAEAFSQEISMSKSNLYRKLISVTGMSPNILLREYRLMKSLDLLKSETRNITQVSFESGFNSPSYFIKCFQKKFGMLPLSYQKAQF